MSEPIDKWCRLDGGRIAHWWIGNEGTACGRDFRVDLRRADLDMPECAACTQHPDAMALAAKENA